MKKEIICCLFLLIHLVYLSLCDNSTCQALNTYFEDFHINLLSNSIVRCVSFHKNATDSPNCLDGGNPCSTLLYALYGDEDLVSNDVQLQNVTLNIGSGVHQLTEGLPIHNATFISFIGVDDTVIECGENPVFSNCSLKNIHISKSSFIYFYGITFQNCQPKVSMLHIQESEKVIFDNCVFR